MAMAEHHIPLGEIMMILMNIFGNVLARLILF